jgi:hypothetical protein
LAALFFRLMMVTKLTDMTSYLLLRNNKESGPYSLNDLVSLGLKPYDLVWANGKSAAWRYPSELPELREFAPPVEEQPFDRFFKKPQEEVVVGQSAMRQSAVEQSTVRQPAVRQSVAEQSAIRQSAVPVVEETRSTPQTAFTPKKSVFVTMPGQKQAAQPAAYKEPAHQQPAYQQYQPKVAETLTEPDYLTKTITITENPVVVETKYSQPLDEIKEMYVKTLQDRKQRIATRAVLIASLKKVAVILAIVGSGVVIGFFLKSNGSNNQVAGTQTPVSASQPLQQQSLTPETNTNITDPAESTSSQPAESFNQPAGEPTREQIQEDIKRIPLVKKETAPAVIDVQEEPEAEKIIPKEKKEVIQPKQKEKEITFGEPSPGVEVNERTGERIRKTRSTTNTTASAPNQEEDKSEANPPTNTSRPKAVMANKNLSKLVAVTTNEYQRVAFGGIRNLQLTVTNDSKYVLDNVLVELAYLKPSEQPLRIDMIPFRNISPGGAMTIRIPDTNRGIKISYRIVSILSKESAKDMADL